MSAVALDRYLVELAQLDATRLDRLVECFAENVRFRDPFNDVHGRAAVRRVFADMLEQLDDIDFQVTARACADAGPLDGTTIALITWHLRARLSRFGGRAWSVEGSSEIHFDASGDVCAHIDYWDAASALYEQLPLIGGVLRTLRRRLSART